MTRLRARIAERLVQAQSTAAMLTTFNEVDLNAVNELRAKLQGTLREGARRAARLHVVLRQGGRRGAEALPGRQCLGRRQRRRLPRVLRHRRRGLDRSWPGRAGAARRGRRCRFAEIEKTVVDVRRRAPAKARSRSRNSPAARSRSPTAACSARCCRRRSSTLPQSAILGMHKIQERPVVVNGQVVVRPMMYLALTYDHRHHRRQGRGAVPGRGQGSARGSGAAAAADLRRG